jgi:hypothetical protein
LNCMVTRETVGYNNENEIPENTSTLYKNTNN